MNPTLVSITIASTLLFTQGALAQEAKVEKPAQTSTDKAKLTAVDLEEKFKTTLTRATMSGRWCSIKDGSLGQESEEKYTILGVRKLTGDAWVINARIQYHNKDLVVPVPVQVKWAGDTPVIIVDKMEMPGGGVFSARVLIYDNTYAGSWSGGNHGGLLSGVITQEKEGTPPAEK